MDKQNLDDKDVKITSQKLGKFQNEYPAQGPEVLFGCIGMRPAVYCTSLFCYPNDATQLKEKTQRNFR